MLQPFLLNPTPISPHSADLTSNGAGSQKVDNVHVVSEVTENFELGHQCLFLCGVGTLNSKGGRVKDIM